MVAPGVTGSGVVKLKSLIVMVEAVLPASEEEEPEDDEEPDVAPEDDDEPDEPQATRVTAHRPARNSRAGAWVPDMSGPICGRLSAVGG
jgi:hypothetical protein